jgi:hypothetical protein
MLVEGGICGRHLGASEVRLQRAGRARISGRHPLVPYWLDDGRRLLELPLTTSFWGMLRKQGEVALPGDVAGAAAARAARARGCSSASR